MKRSWERIHKQLEDKNRDGMNALRPPATFEEVKRAQIELGYEFPEEYIESLYIHDGQQEYKLYGQWRLLPLDEVRKNAEIMRHLLDAGEFDGYQTKKDKELRNSWWRSGWIPVFADDYGDLICIDLEPSKYGNYGQVMMFCHDGAERTVLAKSFKAWMKRVARELTKKTPESESRIRPIQVSLDGKKYLIQNPEMAQKRALQGDWKLSLEALEMFRNQGDASAAASVAYLRAFLGEWNAVIEIAPSVITATDVFPHINVPSEIARLVVRAGMETGDWSGVANVAEQTPEKYGSARKWLLDSVAKRQDVYKSEINLPSNTRSESDNVRLWKAYKRAGVPSTYSKNEVSRMRHRFLMAVEYDRRIIACNIMKTHPSACEFLDAVRIAGWFDPEQAWEEIVNRLDSWSPVYDAQVAPAELLTNHVTREWMTFERCLQVLETPRVRCGGIT